MQTTLNIESMMRTIELLENRQNMELIELKNQWYESMCIVSLGSAIQNSSSNLDSFYSPWKTGFIQNAFSISTGYLIDKMFPKNPYGLMAKLSRYSIETISRKILNDHSNKILSTTIKLLKFIIYKTKN
jgi:elongation factor P hydroxylase